MAKKCIPFEKHANFGITKKLVVTYNIQFERIQLNFRYFWHLKCKSDTPSKMIKISPKISSLMNISWWFICSFWEMLENALTEWTDKFGQMKFYTKNYILNGKLMWTAYVSTFLWYISLISDSFQANGTHFTSSLVRLLRFRFSHLIGYNLWVFQMHIVHDTHKFYSIKFDKILILFES